LINLCGGLIEEGETVLEAAVRELKEESGIVIDKNCEYIGELGKIVDGDSIIHCVAVFLNKSWGRTKH
jgi:8-oxo-dGTP pyrophosphatase MutT (NUDIX family)